MAIHDGTREVDWSRVGERAQPGLLARAIGILAMDVPAREARRQREEWLERVVAATYRDGDGGEVIFSDKLLLWRNGDPEVGSTTDGRTEYRLQLTVFPNDRPERGVNPKDQALVTVTQRGFRSDEVLYAVHDEVTGDIEYAVIRTFDPSVVGYNVVHADGTAAYTHEEAVAACQPGREADGFIQRFVGLNDLLPGEQDE